jgi:hypothetical protein
MSSPGQPTRRSAIKTFFELIAVIASALTIFSFATGIFKVSDIVNMFPPVEPVATIVPIALANPPPPTTRPSPTADNNYSSSTPTPRPMNDGTTWFFSPHPAETLFAFRRSVASMTQYQNGMIVWLQDRGQSFVLFKGGRWQNYGGDIQDTYPAVSSQLGNETRGQRNWVVCEGNTTDGDLTTAYINDPDNRILSWSIQGYNPVRWQYLDGVSFTGCG